MYKIITGKAAEGLHSMGGNEETQRRAQKGFVVNKSKNSITNSTIDKNESMVQKNNAIIAFLNRGTSMFLCSLNLHRNKTHLYIT